MVRLDTIEASAIKYPWGEVVAGFRHSDIIRFMAQRRIKTDGRCVQGFITSRGVFMDRTHAAVYAKVILKSISAEHTGELFSEDLWPDGEDCWLESPS